MKVRGLNPLGLPALSRTSLTSRAVTQAEQAAHKCELTRAECDGRPSGRDGLSRARYFWQTGQ